MGCGGSKGSATMVSTTTDREKNTNNYYGKPIPITYNMEPSKFNNESHHKEAILPPPKPPEQSVEDLLKGKEDMIKRTDEHAKNVSFDKATSQHMTEFTDQTLIPKDVVVEKETVKIVDSTAQNGIPTPDKPPIILTQAHGDTERNKTDTKQVLPPATNSALLVSDADAAELLLEKFKRDNEKAKNLMMVDKMRHDITLKEKLEKRKEMKRKAALTQAVVSSGGDLINEDSAKRLKSDEAIGGMGEARAMDSNMQGFSVEGQDSSIALSNLKSAGEVEAGQDKHDAVMAEAAPLPVAPETRKEAIYGDEDNIELFKDLEDFAVNMEQISSPTTTFAVLMESLFISQLSDLEKVRILFHWITKQDLNIINFPSNIDEDTPMGFLFAIKYERKTYAELFSRLCSAAGLHAKVIYGFLKGVGYLPEHKFRGGNDPFRGSWNAVLIDGQWRLIDTHWGARHVLEDDNNPSKAHETVYRYEEHYFLTNPDQLITTHFPDEEAWQLLSAPITLQQFENLVKVWPLHYKLKLQQQTPLNGLTQAPQDGVVEIRIKMSQFAARDARFKCDFMTKDKKRHVGKHKLACYMFHYAEGEYQVFQFHCPAVNEYIVKIFGESAKFSEDEAYTNIALYQINCTKLKPTKRVPQDLENVLPSEITAPFPDANNPWGPPVGPLSKEIGPLSHGGPILSCDRDGEATLVMKPLNDKLSFMQKLCISDGSINSEKQELPDTAVNFEAHSRSGHKVLVFRIRTPKVGTYSLNLYIKKEEDSVFTEFCNYLVISRAQAKTTAPSFPPASNGHLGVDNICDQMGLQPMTNNKYVKKEDEKYLRDYGSAWLEPNQEDRVVVTFYHSNPLVILVDLESAKGTKTDLSNRTLVEDNGGIAKVIVHPLKHAAETPEYLLKIYAAPVHQTTGIPVIFTAFIRGAQKEARSLPHSPIQRWGANLTQGDFGVNVESILNCEPMFGKITTQDNQSPCRFYTGGNDVVVNLSLSQQLNLRSSLSLIKEKFQEVEGYAFFSQLSTSKATLVARLPKPGDYCLSLFGSPMTDQTEKLTLFSILNILVSATAASSSLVSFPRSFAVWSSSLVHLHSPLSKNLKRNNVNVIKISLAEANGRPYTNVLLLTDKSQPVNPTRAEEKSNIYEWEYVPGAGEKMVSLVVQKTPKDSSLSYVLQFDIVD